ncbi:MAG: hypothetical protein IBX67_07305 [Dehalococcoidia bacterium]|nr:hypothetical protein [Dehalococcoidia bacterium]
MKRFEDILTECIEDVKAGRSSIDDCLDRHPSVRERLEPLLRIALEIRGVPDVKPSPAFKVRARVRFMEQIRHRQAVSRWPWFRYNGQISLSPHRRFSMVHIIVAIALALSALAGGTAYAAQASLPGDPLYSVKLGTEQAGMLLTGDDSTRAERALSLAERRVREMVTLSERGRSQDLGLAVEKYEYALNTALARMEAAGDAAAGGSIGELVAEATVRHLSVLDTVSDSLESVEAKEAITHAKYVSETGHLQALEALARVNPGKAVEINMAAAEARLHRAGATAERGDIEELQDALQQFAAMAGFAEEISRIAQQVGIDVNRVEELVAEATFQHLEELVDVWQRAPGQAQSAIRAAVESAMTRHERAFQVLEQRGAGPPASEITPERIQEREKMRERVEQIMDDSVPPALNLPGGAPAGWSCPGCGR